MDRNKGANAFFFIVESELFKSNKNCFQDNIYFFFLFGLGIVILFNIKELTICIYV